MSQACRTDSGIINSSSNVWEVYSILTGVPIVLRYERRRADIKQFSLQLLSDAGSIENGLSVCGSIRGC